MFEPTVPPINVKLDNNEPVYGMTIYSGSQAIVESLGYSGLDFAFLDAEHTPDTVGSDMERLVMSCLLSGVSPLVRVRGCIEWDIRKALEMGAQGVIIPHVKTAREAEEIVRAAKFPPLGRRGADSSVRAARFGTAGFNWGHYIEQSNSTSLVIPMAEDYEFFDNIDEILDVEGIDVINYGPADYANSLARPISYSLHSGDVGEKLALLVEKCHDRGVKVMAPVVPPTLENVKALLDVGVDMLIVGSDLHHFQAACNSVNAVIDQVSKAGETA